MKPFNEHNPKRGFKMKPGDYAFHGDVILFAEKELPDDFDQMPIVKDRCIAYGEATGHAHQLQNDDGAFELRECPKTKTRWLKVVKETMLKHQEHEPRGVPPGLYRTGIQVEYDPFEKLSRQVVD